MIKRRRGEKSKPTGEVYALGKSTTSRAESASGTKRSGTFSGPGAPSRSSDFPSAPPKVMRLTSEESQSSHPTVDPARLVKEVNNLYDPGQPQKVQHLLTNALIQLKSSRPRVPPILGLALLNIARQHPDVFGQTFIVEQLCVLLKREANARNSRNLHILICNLLMAGLRDSNTWPPNLVKLYAEDCLSERSWVDKDETRLFVRNLETAFPNVIRDIHSVLPALASSQMTPMMNLGQGIGVQPTATTSRNPAGWDFVRDWSVGNSVNSPIRARYEGMRVALEKVLVPMIKEHMMRRIGVDSHQRSLIRLMTMCAGFPEVRLLSIQKLDPWLQMQKLQPTAIALMKSICANCNTFSSSDKDVIHHVINKLRKLVSHNSQYYIDSLRYLAGAHESNLPHMLAMVVSNENSPTRNKNNPVFFPALVNFNTKAAHESLGDIFHDIIVQNDSSAVRGLRQTYREICKWFKCDAHFVIGVFEALLRDRSDEPNFLKLERSAKDTYIYNLVDMMCVTQLNCAFLTSVREAFSGKRESMEPLRSHYNVMRRIRIAMVRWFHTVLPNMTPGIEEDRVLALFHKAFFLGNHLTEDYFVLEPGWPPEPDRNAMSILCGDTPLTDNMIIVLLDAALKPQHPLSPSSALDILLIICQKAARVNQEIVQALKMTKVHEVIEMLYEAAQYPHRANVNWPTGYVLPTLMDRNLYWKVNLILVLIAAHNLDTVGQIMWKDYDTVRSLMEMLMTNNFEFPTQTLLVRRGMTAEDFANQERTVRQQERNMILDYESKMTDRVTTERSSQLLSRVAHYLPKGPARPPPDDLLARLKEWNTVVGLGRRLCTYRDFLLELIQIQRSSPAVEGQGPSGRTWLVKLVEESSEASLSLLPIQCLSEYLIHDITLTSMDQHRLEKQFQLVTRLRAVAAADSTDEVSVEQVDMLQPFIDRLTWETEHARCVARACLRRVLSVDHGVVEKGLILSYLVTDLPTLACYQSSAVRELFISRIHQAVLIETDQPSVVSYLTLLYNHAMQEAASQPAQRPAQDTADEEGEREGQEGGGDANGGIAMIQGNPWSRLVDTLTRFLLSRPILFQSILQNHIDAVRYMMDTFLQYLNAGQQSAFPVEENEPLLVVNFGASGHCALSLHALHAQLFLLSQAALRRELADDPLFQQLLNKWFLNEIGEMNSMEIVTPRHDGSIESEILPDYLKPHLLRSGVPSIVNKVVTTLNLRNILDLLPEEHSYSFPSTVMNIILHRADALVMNLVPPQPELPLSRARLNKLQKSVHNWLSSPAAVQYGMNFYRFIHDSLARSDASPEHTMVRTVADEMAEISKRIQMDENKTDEMDTQEDEEDVGDWLSALGKTSELRDLIRRMSEDEERLIHSQICTEISQRLGKRDGSAWFESVLVGNATRFLPLLKILLTNNTCKDAKRIETKFVSRLKDHLKKYKNRSKAETLPIWSSLIDEYSDDVKMDDDAPVLPIDEMKDIGEDEGGDDSNLGALVDWLTLMDPESEESCQSTKILESLFMDNGGSSQLLLAHRLHKCNLSSLQRCAETVLNRDPQGDINVNSTRVLDFIQACIDHPRLQYALTGASPIFPCSPALQLLRTHIYHLLEHVERECALLINIRSDEALLKMRNRVRMVLKACGDRTEIKEDLVRKLAARAEEDLNEAKQLLFIMYSECPALLVSPGQGSTAVSWLTKDMTKNQNKIPGVDLLGSDEIAKLGRNLLCSLLNSNDTAQEDAAMACKSLACHHPLLFCRHLPLMAGLLEGRLDGSWIEFRRRNYHLLFSYVIHIVELMAPHCFLTQSTEKISLNGILKTFLMLLKRYRHDKGATKDSGYKSTAPTLKPMADKVSRVLIAYHRHAQTDFLTFVRENEADLNTLGDQFAAISSVNAIIKSKDTGASVGALEGAASATKMAPFVRKLRESTEQSVILGVLQDMQITSKRKPEILDHFVIDLQNLLSHSMTEIRELAFNLLGRYLNKHPECAFNVLKQSFLPCLCVNPLHPGVTESALKRLPEMLLLAPTLAPDLLRATAHLAVAGGNQAALTATSDLVHLINLESLLVVPLSSRSGSSR